MSMNKCATCVHWKKPGEREDFYSVVEYNYPGQQDKETYARYLAKGEEAGKIYGLCIKNTMHLELGLDDELPLAVTMDGSQYQANLFTQAEFGCVSHEPTKE